MKKLVKMSMIIPVVLIVGIVLDVVGFQTENVTLAKVGMGILMYGLPATMFILVVVGLILMITGRLSDSDKDKKSDVTFGESSKDAAEDAAVSTAAEKEDEKLEKINSSYGYDSRKQYAEYQMDHVANAYKHSDRGDRIKGWLFFGFLMTDFALILVFAFLGIMVGALVCFCLFAGTIILSLIIKVILEKTSMSRRVNTDKYEQRSATVKACVLSSTGSTGGGRSGSTVRVRSVTYRIILDVDGSEYNAYSGNVYGEGEEVTVWVRKSGGRMAKIVERTPEETAAQRREQIEEMERKLAERSAHLEKLERDRGEYLQKGDGRGEEK